MYDYVIHTSINDMSQLNQLAIFVGSFIETHKKGRVVCITDLELDFEMPRLSFERELPEEYVYISVDNFFMDKTYGVSSFIDAGRWHCAWQPGDVDDFVVKRNGEREGLINPRVCIANYNISKHGDLEAYYRAIDLVKECVSINTKDFKPDEENKRNSMYTLVFPWEIYFHVMMMYSQFIDEGYIERVVANCNKFVHSIYYRQSGVLRDQL